MSVCLTVLLAEHKLTLCSYYIGISNICSVTGWGDENNPVTKALKLDSRLRPNTISKESQDQPTHDTASEVTPPSTKFVPNTKQFPNALRLFAGTYNIVSRRFGDPNILPYLHVSLVFIHHLTLHPNAMVHIAPHFPWKLTALILNTLLESSSSSISASSQNVSQAQDLFRLLDEGAPFPGSSTEKDGEQKAIRRRKPLPDDYTLRGFSWSETYFPFEWFVVDEKIDDDDKYFEVPSMMEERRERVVWLGGRIAESGAGRWLRLAQNETGRSRFEVHSDYEVDLDLEMPGQLPPTPGDLSVEYGDLPDAGPGPK